MEDGKLIRLGSLSLVASPRSGGEPAQQQMEPPVLQVMGQRVAVGDTSEIDLCPAGDGRS